MPQCFLHRRKALPLIPSSPTASGPRALPRAAVARVPAARAPRAGPRHAVHRHRLGQARRQGQSVSLKFV